MPDDLILAIDNGTQSVRALLSDLRGNLVAKSQVRLTDYSSPQPGWMEHDSQSYWNAVCAACQALWRDNAHAQAAVQGVAVTTQRGTVIHLDRNGQPLRRAIVWLDQRRTDPPPALHPLWQAAFKVARQDHTIPYLLAQAESNWIKTFEPEVWRNTHKYLLLSGYLNYRLSGEFVDAVGSQVACIPFDYRRGKWAHRFDWKWRALSLEPSMLPRLFASGSVMASVSANAAAESGIPAGTPVSRHDPDRAGFRAVSPQSRHLRSALSPRLSAHVSAPGVALQRNPQYHGISRLACTSNRLERLGHGQSRREVQIS